ncbi:hypothetical protein [Bradyrhizobium sp. SZCCHNR1093]|uniref:hypothetical protein n=1 Tax=Bradyrhizobium sp. SZCCHNR1093 TaxID=3057368 RepID=UPI0028E33AAC|nr:hypothetical protein [Bradyrhizobium sp. SZCCHNR1093]
MVMTEMPALTAIAAILTALAAVIIAPAMANRTAKLQIRANVVSVNRQAWIDKLRDELAELFELLTWRLLQRPGTSTGEEGARYEAEKRSRIRLLTNKVRLRLNPLESDSQSLVDLLTRLNQAASRGEEADFDELMEKAVTTAQTILKTEWRRVKNGE